MKCALVQADPILYVCTCIHSHLIHMVYIQMHTHTSECIKENGETRQTCHIFPGKNRIEDLVEECAKADLLDFLKVTLPLT